MTKIGAKGENVQEAQAIWTIGHSTRSAEEFKDILKRHQIQMLIDVRAFPASRRYPQFNKETLAETVADESIAYQHFPMLGGRRRPSPDSINIVWKNDSFRAYADYMETADFRQGVESLCKLASARRTVVMCAEAVWWRCHRALIADYLKAQGWAVIHIVNGTRTEVHPYTSAASIVKGKLSYEGLLREIE